MHLRKLQAANDYQSFAGLYNKRPLQPVEKSGWPRMAKSLGFFFVFWQALIFIPLFSGFLSYSHSVLSCSCGLPFPVYSTQTPFSFSRPQKSWWNQRKNFFHDTISFFLQKFGWKLGKAVTRNFRGPIYQKSAAWKLGQPWRMVVVQHQVNSPADSELEPQTENGLGVGKRTRGDIREPRQKNQNKNNQFLQILFLLNGFRYSG